MRLPISSSSPQSSLKPSLSTTTTTNTTSSAANTTLNISLQSPSHINPPLCYEPTSVLDLCRSPSPPTDHSAVIESVSKPTEEPVEADDEHAFHGLDWDSIMKDLDLHDTSLKTTSNIINNNNNSNNIPHHHPTNPCDPHQVPILPDFPPSSHDPSLPFDHASADFTLSDIYSNQNLGYSINGLDHLVYEFNPNGFDLIEVLIRAADCFDSNQLHLAQAILDRLNQRLRSPVGKPLQRAAFYFKEALQSFLSGSNRTPRVSSLLDIVQTIKTFKAFSGISPIPMFSIFTTNQALLEAFHGSSFVHVIDFDIGLGIQYASLMKEIAEKAESVKINAPLLRITAMVPEEYAGECKLIRENLNQFALELRIRVQVEFVPLRTFEMMSFKAVKFMDGEKTAVLLSPSIFRRLGSTNNVAAFLSDVRRISPCVVVFVDGEGWAEAAVATSFRRGVVSSLEFYSMMLESLDASTSTTTNTAVGGGGDWVKRIEMLLLRPQIMAAVEGVGRMVSPWREVFYGAGMRPVQLSQFADFQAECLLAKVQIRGFQVAKRQAELVLCWHERAMVATSAWRC